MYIYIYIYIYIHTKCGKKQVFAEAELLAALYMGADGIGKNPSSLRLSSSAFNASAKSKKYWIPIGP